MTFADKLAGAVAKNESRLCVGLDPDPAKISGDVADYLRAVIEATSDLVACYKPNLAFYEALGRDGYRVLARVLEAIPGHVPVLGDAKRGDIGNTAEAYARALFDVWGFDAVTVNAWGGRDTLDPYISRADRGVFIWCRGSNPGARDFQDVTITDGGEARRLFELVATRAQEWNVNGNLGLVAGATYPADIARMRALCPEMPLLVPGVGAQGGDLEGAVRAAAGSNEAMFVINASRQVLYAGPGGTVADASRQAAMTLRDAINAALQRAGV